MENETQLRSGAHASARSCRASLTPIATDRTPIALFYLQNRTAIAPDRTPIALPIALFYLQNRTFRKILK